MLKQCQPRLGAGFDFRQCGAQTVEVSTGAEETSRLAQIKPMTDNGECTDGGRQRITNSLGAMTSPDEQNKMSETD